LCTVHERAPARHDLENGKYLWISNESNAIYQVDRCEHGLITLHQRPGGGSYNPRGLAWKSLTQTIWAGYQSAARYPRAQSGDRDGAPAEFASPYGTVSRASSWDGWFLWATGGSKDAHDQPDRRDHAVHGDQGRARSSTGIQFELTRADNQAKTCLCGVERQRDDRFKVG